jgi:hypothetical protein
MQDGGSTYVELDPGPLAHIVRTLAALQVSSEEILVAVGAWSRETEPDEPRNYRSNYLQRWEAAVIAVRSDV